MTRFDEVRTRAGGHRRCGRAVPAVGAVLRATVTHPRRDVRRFRVVSPIPSISADPMAVLVAAPASAAGEFYGLTRPGARGRG